MCWLHETHMFHWASLMMTWGHLGHYLETTLAYYGILWHTLVQDCGRWCKMVQNNAIPCYTMQYHASLITADGAYHCPVGSIWLFFIFNCSSFFILVYLGPLEFAWKPSDSCVLCFLFCLSVFSFLFPSLIIVHLSSY